MSRRNLFVGVAVAVLVGVCATALHRTAAGALAPVPPASSNKAQLRARGGAEWFTNIQVNAPATRPFGAAAAPSPTAMKRYVGVATTPLATAPGGSAFATLYVSAAVTIADTEAGMAHVSTNLWMHGDMAVSGPLYATPRGFEVGWLDGTAGHAIPGTVSNGWTPVRIDGYLAANSVVESLESVWRIAEFSYQFICADCHSLHATEDYSPMQWGTIVNRMATFAKLGPDDTMVILKWLQTTSASSASRK
jgi:hypothetical protein